MAEPKFITYLLDNTLKHDAYFLVGTERIGAVKYMLCAHSEVLRCELEDSMLKEEGVIVINDIASDTFINLLQYVYGYNNIHNHSFDLANNLLYVSEKYLMIDLKNEIALRLMTLLNAENICSLLNNPVCHTVMEMNSPITEILQLETDEVFASPAFLDIRLEVFIRILEQDVLNVSEIEVWRAALKWTKHKVGSANGGQLQELLRELKHIRIRAISFKDFCEEIAPSKVVTAQEALEFCIAHGKSEELPAVKGFSDKTEGRFHFESELLPYNIPMQFQRYVNPSTYQHELCTSESELKLLSFTFRSRTAGPQNITVEIRQDDPYPLDTAKVISYDRFIERDTYFKLPLKCKGRYVQLLPNKTYIVRCVVKVPHDRFRSASGHSSWSSSALTVTNYSPPVVCPFSSVRYINCSTGKIRGKPRDKLRKPYLISL